MSSLECRLHKSIVHTFPSSGDADQNPYVFDVCSNSENLLAVSACGPGHVIKVYDKMSLTCVNQLPGHSAKVNDLHFFPADPNGLYSASSDGTLRLWDLRAPMTNVHTFSTGGREVWAASVSIDSNFVAGGVLASLRTWDLRTRKAYRAYSDVHTDDVTCVRSHPFLASVFVTGSEDGLMCAVNNASVHQDDALEAVINVNVAISRIGFLGAQAQQVYAVTNVHGIQIWDFGAFSSTDFSNSSCRGCDLQAGGAAQAQTLLVNVEDLRPACSMAASLQVLQDEIRLD